MKYLISLLFVTASLFAAQVDIRVLSSPGSTLYSRVTNAQALCPSLPDTCNLIFEVYIPKHPGEVLPSMCSNCTWADSRIIHEPPPSVSLVPSGGIVFISSGTCATGYTEINTTGKYLLFTTTAGADIGGVGGSTSYTPVGTNGTPTFMGTSSQATSSTSAGTPTGNVTAATFTGTSSQATSSVSGGTPAGTLGAQTFTGNVQNFTTASNVSLLGIGAALTGPTSITPTGTVATGVFTGATLSTHAHTITATGTNSTPSFTGDTLGTHSHTLTPAGTISIPSFTGSAATIQPPYIKLIACQKD